MSDLEVRVRCSGFALELNMGKLDLSFLFLSFLDPSRKSRSEVSLPDLDRQSKPVVSSQPVFSVSDPRALPLTSRINSALRSGLRPVLCDEGDSGAYFVSDSSGQRAAVFKASCEAIQASKPNATQSASSVNPLTCSSAVREVAAYVLDKSSDDALRAGVPATYVASYYDPTGPQQFKVGSLQQYSEHEAASWDMGPSAFSVRDVHAIALLDLRLLNTDRHGGNMLVSDNKTLVPIDHSLCLPEVIPDSGLWFEWMTWPQAKQPFSAEHLAALETIDMVKDALLLSKCGIKDSAIMLAAMSTLLLIRSTKAGLTLYDIGRIMCRPSPREPSQFEQLVKTAQHQSTSGPTFTTLFVKFSELLTDNLKASST